MQWYYSKGAVQLGPISEAELKAKIASGEITTSDMVWKDGMADWVPLARVPELIAKAPAAAQTPPSIPGGSASPYIPPVSAPHPSVNHSGLPIPNYLWQSIAVTVCCCLPFGIPAIVYAAKVDSLQAQGDIQGALAASKSAKTWVMVSICSWLAVVVLYILTAVIVGVSGVH